MSKRNEKEIASRISRLKEERRKLAESRVVSKFSVLLESDINQAELIIATRDISERLTKIAADITKIQTDLLPISDALRNTFGPELSSKWESDVANALNGAMFAIRSNRDAITNANLALEGKEVPVANDMGSYEDPADLVGEAGDDAKEAEASDEDMDDNFGAAEDTGRVKKESVQLDRAILESANGYFSKVASYNKKLAESQSSVRKQELQKRINEARSMYEASIKADNYRDVGTRLLMQESLDSLVTWFMEAIQPSAQPERYAKLAADIQRQRTVDPAGLAGFIGQKKYGNGLVAQLSNPVANVSSDVFNEAVTPPAPVTPPTAPGSLTTTKGPVSPPLNTTDKKNAATAIASISAKVAQNKSEANKGVDSAVNSLQGPERAAAQKMVNKMKADGKAPQKVSDFLDNSEETLKESVDYKNLLSKSALMSAELSSDKEDYTVAGRIKKVEVGYTSASGKYTVRQFGSIEAAQQEAYKVVANGGKIDDVAFVRREKLESIDSVFTFIDIENVVGIEVTGTYASGREFAKNFRDVARAEKFILEVQEKSGQVLTVVVDRQFERETEGGSLEAKQRYLERSLKTMTASPSHDEDLADNYAKRLSKVREQIDANKPVEVLGKEELIEDDIEEAKKPAGKGNKLSRMPVRDFDKKFGTKPSDKKPAPAKKPMEEAEEAEEDKSGPWYKDFKSAAKYAWEDSKNGYVQCVETYEDGYLVSDWYDADVTVATYENGRQKYAADGYEYDPALNEVSSARLSAYSKKSTEKEDAHYGKGETKRASKTADSRDLAGKKLFGKAKVNTTK